MMTPDDPEVQRRYWRRVANTPGRTVCLAFDDLGRIVPCELPYRHPGSHLVRLERNAYRRNDHRGSDNRIIDWPPRIDDLDSARSERTRVREPSTAQGFVTVFGWLSIPGLVLCLFLLWLQS